jgi:hypothetical protein
MEATSTNPFSALFTLADDALLEETTRLAARERRSTAQLIAALSEVDARRLYLSEGCSSAYSFCRHVLKLSEHAAYDRIAAARLARKFPVILEQLAEGTLTLSNLTLIAPFVTAENYVELLAAVANKSKHDAEAVVAPLRPRLASPEFYRLQLAVSREAWEHLQRLQDLLRHSIPDGDPSRIVEKGLAVLLAQVEKKKMAKVENPRPPTEAAAGSRHVPAAVRREVWDRDGGCCAFVGPQGRCGETRGLEFHHLEPFGAGGPTTAANLELRCRAHNQHEADVFYGDRGDEELAPGRVPSAANPGGGS